MKAVTITLLTLITLALMLFYMMSDRDRSMWVLNTAIKLANPHDVITDVQYGEEEWQKLDIYPSASNEAQPVVLFVHGGSWRHGRKDQYRFAADAFIRLGYTVVVSDYLKYPDPRAKYPSFVSDTAKALRWVKDNISEYNGSADNVFLAGHSAGAHTVVMLSADSSHLEAEDLSSEDIRGVIGIAGPYSFIPDWEVTKAVFGPEDRYPLMDALNYIDGSEPNFLLMHSAADEQVGQYNTDKLYDLIKQKGGLAKKKIYNELSHIDMVTHLHPWFAKQVSITKDIDQFIRESSN